MGLRGWIRLLNRFGRNHVNDFREERILTVRVLTTVLVVLALALGVCLTGTSSSRVVRIRIGPDVVDCVGVGPRKCLLVKESENPDWEFFYDGIEGFTHIEGVSYVLDVEITEIEDPPADASSLDYRLVQVVEATSGAG